MDLPCIQVLSMRHSGTFRRWAISAFIIGATLVVGGDGWAVPAANADRQLVSLITSPQPLAPSAISISSYRSGRHDGFSRLVLDLSARAKFAVTAMTAEEFLLTVWNARWAAPISTPLAADAGTRLGVRILGPDGVGDAFRVRVTSAHPAFVRRAFLLPPSDKQVSATTAPKWRLVVDLVEVKQAARNPNIAASMASMALPAMHGLIPDGPRKKPAPPPALEPILITGDSNPWRHPLPPTTPVAGSTIDAWARASRLLQELRDRSDPRLSGPIGPQLVLPAKYRRNLVPLR